MIERAILDALPEVARLKLIVLDEMAVDARLASEAVRLVTFACAEPSLN